MSSEFTVTVYNFIHSKFPEIAPTPLRSMRTKVETEQIPAPKEPRMYTRFNITIKPGENIFDIFKDEYKKAFPESRNVDYVNLECQNASIYLREFSYKYEERAEDFSCNCTYDCSCYEPSPVKVKGKHVTFNLSVKNPCYDEQHRTYEQEMLRYRSQIDSRKQNKEFNKIAESNNKAIINNFIHSNKDLWSLVCKFIDSGSTDYNEIKQEYIKILQKKIELMS